MVEADSKDVMKIIFGEGVEESSSFFKIVL